MYRHELRSTKLKRYTQQRPHERSRRVASAIKPSFVSRDKNEDDQNTKVQTSSIIKRSNFTVERCYSCKADGPKLRIA